MPTGPPSGGATSSVRCAPMPRGTPGSAPERVTVSSPRARRRPGTPRLPPGRFRSPIQAMRPGPRGAPGTRPSTRPAGGPPGVRDPDSAAREARPNHREFGFFAGQALRYLDDLRVEYGRLDADLPVGDEGGTVRVELNHADPSVLPAGFRLGDNDTRILSVARSLAAEGDSVVLVSKDLPLRVKAAAIGLTAQEYRAELPADSGWTGMRELDVTAAEIDELYAEGRLDCAAARDLPCHTGLVLVSGASGAGSALGRVQPDKAVRLVRGDREGFGLRGRSAEQRVALDLLLDQDVGIVSLGGRAGTGKAALALCAGLEAVVERHQHRKLRGFRPLDALGGQELGYLPGSEADKMNPWSQAVYDTLSAVTSQDVSDEVLARDMPEGRPRTD